MPRHLLPYVTTEWSWLVSVWWPKARSLRIKSASADLPPSNVLGRRWAAFWPGNSPPAFSYSASVFLLPSINICPAPQYGKHCLGEDTAQHTYNALPLEAFILLTQICSGEWVHPVRSKAEGFAINALGRKSPSLLVSEPKCSAAQLSPTLCHSMDCSSPGSSVHGISQARILEWVAISSSRESSWPTEGNNVTGVCCIGRRLLSHCTTWGARLSPGGIPNRSEIWAP